MNSIELTNLTPPIFASSIYIMPFIHSNIYKIKLFSAFKIYCIMSVCMEWYRSKNKATKDNISKILLPILLQTNNPLYNIIYSHFLVTYYVCVCVCTMYEYTIFVSFLYKKSHMIVIWFLLRSILLRKKKKKIVSRKIEKLYGMAYICITLIVNWYLVIIVLMLSYYFMTISRV